MCHRWEFDVRRLQAHNQALPVFVHQDASIHQLPAVAKNMGLSEGMTWDDVREELQRSCSIADRQVCRGRTVHIRTNWCIWHDMDKDIIVRTV